jgi:hypothetical protein
MNQNDMAQQTAVEWLVQQLKTIYDIDIERLSATDKAKKMEKEQKIEFAKLCLNKALDTDVRTAYNHVEKYYNETHGGNE